MSNLRIKNKRLKRELKSLKQHTVPVNIAVNQKEIVELRSSLMLTDEDLLYLDQCVDQVKWTLLEEAKDYIKVDLITPGTNDSGLPYPILKARLGVVRKENL